MSTRTIVRAPRDNGTVVAVPSLDRALVDIEENYAAFAGVRKEITGRSLSELRTTARRALFAQIRQYYTTNGEAQPDLNGTRLIMAGHQPELFHPGVWLKNFALHALARRCEGVGVNLIVDNDTIKSVALKVPAPPTPSHPWPRLVNVPFDIGSGEIPWEHRHIRDEAMFESFPERVGHLLQGWSYLPLVPAFWTTVCEHLQRTDRIGECFAFARRNWERKWGCNNAEVTVGRLSDTEPFAWLACTVLDRLADFHSSYNVCVRDYRRRYRIRSRHHPVPELGVRGDFLEAPFWVWRGGGRRERLFVRNRGDSLELREGEQLVGMLPLPVSRAVLAWSELSQRGFAIRPRALTTTMFARLFVADLFIHGIGGGKYDELTDDIIRRWWEIEPPKYLVLSGTLHLPLPLFPVTTEVHLRQQRLLRDVSFNPQRHQELLGATSPELSAFLAVKEECLSRSSVANLRERHSALRQLERSTRPLLEPTLENLRRELRHSEQALHANAILQRRDYSFCLFPETSLGEFLRMVL